ncbi:uncharacterized protein LOC116349018 [Contarinia nasturtii]|uniref:uncharacterized protein LOC116349018 n=1 Tax=Contarinia nasturtii TaxID=265458 RepID=UPI0012D4C2F3|nr:uncharacterized protein LOC116349018 [Contarinia nasturtii]
MHQANGAKEGTNSGDKSTFRRIFAQVLAVTVKNLLILDLGFCYAFAIIAIPALTGIHNKYNQNETLLITVAEASWIGSLMHVLPPIGCLFSALITGISTWTQEINDSCEYSTRNWMVYVISRQQCLGSICWNCNARSRGVASGIAAATNYVFGFVTKKTYHNLENTLSMQGTTMLYCMISGFGLVLTYFILPETENRSLEEIELHFADNSKSITDRKIPKLNSEAVKVNDDGKESERHFSNGRE